MPVKDYLPIVPWVTTAAAVLYALAITCKCAHKNKGKGKGSINECIQKDCDKVVHSLDIEDLGNKTSFCRCWKSAKFPYCDGTHNKHNEECGDNVGPLVLKRKEA